MTPDQSGRTVTTQS